MFLALVAHGAQPRQRHVDPDPVPQQQQEQPPAPLLPATAAYSLQHRSIVHRADGMQGIGITLAGMLLAFQLAERSNRSLYTDWPMFLESFEGKNELPEELSGLPTQSLEAWTWALPGHETTTVGAAARAAAADEPTVLELSGDDLSVEQVRDAWRSAMNKSASEEQTFEDYNRHIFFERCVRGLSCRRPLACSNQSAPFRARRYKPTSYVREHLAALGRHERVVHIRVGDSGGEDGEGPCHVEDSRIDLSAGMAALQNAILDHWNVPLAEASSILLLSDCAEVYQGLSAFAQPSWGVCPFSGLKPQSGQSRARGLLLTCPGPISQWLHHSNLAASTDEWERTWAEFLAMRNATEIMHTPSAFSSMAVRTSENVQHEWQVCNGDHGAIAAGKACAGLASFFAASARRRQLNLLQVAPGPSNGTAPAPEPSLSIRRARPVKPCTSC